MADQNTDRRKMFSDCFAWMPKMMRNMALKKGGSCCSCVETMAEMTPERCRVETRKEHPAEEQGQDAPK